ncbi:uncharacterized protein TRIADDRAFT_61584 [Trichoplax adhaerens]|uniref:G-protein coupled receptors family 1 profile domain-containing protein n=1 Tax=Trichoplax adhaerens TaxID=10228 RepID=B3SBE3_TRIAD|nr:hypothetical protein TRIADDRAFT_61584 [Trichoplax adhaerens]EDV19937.1 hypothetical protein TRIADDRAFT_61584 [Trichoplax adhaerens]|eukprot:XP_002117527.1 hypothetical protein TRIADDRAFT_61584 [Trichoplax adhaerens]
MQPALTVMACLYIMIMVIAIPGNSLILWITLANRHLRTPTNLMVCNLAVAGLLLASIQIPFKIFDLLSPIQSRYYYPFSVSVCKMTLMIPGVCVTAISFTLMAICVDRYRAIVTPIKFKLITHPVKVAIFLPLCWLFAFSLLAPYGAFATIHPWFEQRQVCVVNWMTNHHLDIIFVKNRIVYFIPFSKMILWLLFIILVFLVPTIIMTMLYSIAARVLWREGLEKMRMMTSMSLESSSISRERCASLSLDEHRLKARKRTIKILIACFILFIASNLPYYTLLTLFEFKLIQLPNYFVRYGLINAFVLLNYTCIAYNAIIYGYFNYNFRRNAPRWFHLKNYCSQCR